MNKKHLAYIIISLAISISFGVSGLVLAQTERTFTSVELAKYNGQNGAPAYAAVNGVVYDLTAVPEWANGRHFCQNAAAGKDLTWLWNLTPRSHRRPEFLRRFTVVGKLVAAKPSSSSVVPTPSTLPQVTTTPNTPTSGDQSLTKTLLIGLGIAVAVTLLWFGLRFRKSGNR